MAEEIELNIRMIPYLKPGLIVIGEDLGWEYSYGLVAITPEVYDVCHEYDRYFTMPVSEMKAVSPKGVEDFPYGLFLVLDSKDEAVLMEAPELLDPRMDLSGLRIGLLKRGKPE